MAETLPLFPLGTVLLPGASLPLHIFEPRYRQLVVDLMTGSLFGRTFGVVCIKEGWEVGADNIGSLKDIGCSADLLDARPLPEGRFDIVTRGVQRFRLVDVDTTTAPYLLGRVEYLDDSPVPEAAKEVVPILERGARAAHERYCGAAWHREDWSAPAEDVELGALSYLLAADCLLPVEDRQRLLEETSPARRLRLVRRMLHRETGILSALKAVPVPLTEFGHVPNPN
ncbi:peptidase [Lentzea aerocolonigenes]|uniref:Peptidase n=1 Tax=Lentzea aerocolonigenes TaxID=68170 RepID=A0A0F0GVI9_LENAE|nr:LON peptidase substrate-binding domain-containing protein [Lentzea aerocolonigenes]KJK45423.1 peptidase [Lentzea aerocolonigenes]